MNMGGTMSLTDYSVLSKADLNTKYIVKRIETDDSDIKDFLFSLGCYEGESITIVSKLAGQFVVSIKDGRYSIDKDLAQCIYI